MISGRAGLVDEDGVDLVDDGVAMAALHHVLERAGHVVAEVVEAELGVRPVGDVAQVGVLLRLPVVDVGRDPATVIPRKRWIWPIHSASRRAR